MARQHRSTAQEHSEFLFLAYCKLRLRGYVGLSCRLSRQIVHPARKSRQLARERAHALHL